MTNLKLFIIDTGNMEVEEHLIFAEDLVQAQFIFLKAVKDNPSCPNVDAYRIKQALIDENWIEADIKRGCVSNHFNL
jgi:hypothetical protein